MPFDAAQMATGVFGFSQLVGGRVVSLFRPFIVIASADWIKDPLTIRTED